MTAYIQDRERLESGDSARRRAMSERENGVFTNSQTDGTVTYNSKKEIAFPKSLRPARDGAVRLGDRMRIFGRAMSGARPWEQVDIMICRQSM